MSNLTTQVGTRDDAPQSFIFFVVANVGPRKEHRPIAVVLRHGGPYGVQPIQGHLVIYSCLQAINCFSDVANRRAIQAELSLATEFYKNDSEKSLVPRAELPEFNRWINNDEQEARRIRPWDTSLSEFPFISTCLLVSVGRDLSGQENNARKEPLGTIYRDDSIEYGMVVIDISDLGNVSYGIVGFMVHRMAGFHRRYCEALGVWQTVPPFVEDHRPRVPLSSWEYMTKFHPGQINFPDQVDEIELWNERKERARELERKPLIDISAMDYIWPGVAPEEGGTGTTSREQHENGTRTLTEQSIASLVDELLKAQTCDVSLLEEAGKTPRFQKILRHELLDRLERNQSNYPEALGNLLGIAFAGQEHLDWILLKGLTTDAISAAMDSQKLNDAKYISLCIDDVLGSPTQLIDALSLCKNLRELYLLQAPTRNSDGLSTQVFLALAASSHAHLLRCKIFLTGAFSAPLSKTFWLPTTKFKSNFEAVQHVFLRHRLEPLAYKSPYWPNHIYLGDALLQPEYFAAGFLEVIRTHLFRSSDHRKYDFSHAAPSLEDMSRMAISPIPAENFSIPIWPMLRWVNHSMNYGPECLPKVRDLQAGTWVSLVSQERYLHPEPGTNNQAQTMFVMYALVRLKQDVAIDMAHTLDPEMIEVCGLKEFLQITAPEANLDLVDQRIEGLKALISSQPRQGSLPPGLDWVSLFEPDEVCDILQDFLEDAEFGKRNLVMAMKDKPKERNWYPELLKEVDDSQVLQDSNSAADEISYRRYVRRVKNFSTLHNRTRVN